MEYLITINIRELEKEGISPVNKIIEILNELISLNSLISLKIYKINNWTGRYYDINIYLRGFDSVGEKIMFHILIDELLPSSFNNINDFCKKIFKQKFLNINNDIIEEYPDSTKYELIFNNCSRGNVYNELDNFNDYCELLRYEKSLLNLYIASIKYPEISRFTNNPNKNTFDFIRIELMLCTPQEWTRDELRQFIKRNKKIYCEAVLNKIKETKRFAKFNIPINFLKLTSLTITNCRSLIFIFELKDIKGEEK